MAACLGLFLLNLLILVVISAQRRDRIPIGAIFDHGKTKTQSAFAKEVMHSNKQPNAIEIQSTTLRTYSNDSFHLANTMCNLMGGGLFMMFGTHNTMTLNDIRSYTSVFHVPYISVGQPVNNTGQKKGYITYMHPYLPAAIVDVMGYYNWQRVHYLYDSQDGMVRMQQVIDALIAKEYDVQIYMHRVNGVSSVYETLIHIAMNGYEGPETRHILLDIPLEEVDTLLYKQKTDTIRVRFHYFAVRPGISELVLEPYNHGGVNLTGFSLIQAEEPGVTNSFLRRWSHLDAEIFSGADGTIPYEAALAVDSVGVITRALKNVQTKHPGIFAATLRHGSFLNNGSDGILCDSEPIIPWTYGPEIQRAIRQVEFSGMTGPISFDENGLRTNLEVSVFDLNLNREMSKVGTWSDTRGLTVQKPAPIREKTAGTTINKTRIVTTILSEPYLIRKTETDANGNPIKYANPNDQFTGYCAEMAKALAKVLDIKYIIRPVKDGKYGSKDENGTWNGMVGELIRNDADLAIAPLTITSEREKVIDFSKPFMSLGISIMIKKPTKDVPGVFSFMKPLSYEIWMCVIFAYIGVSVVLFLVSRFSPFEWHIEDNTDGPTVTNNFTIFNSLWFSLGAFMQQGCDIEPRSMSGRVVGSVWWFFTLIVISSYTANLAAFLTVERMQSPIESAEDLAKQTEIRYGTIDSGSTQEFFKSSTIAVYERMWAFMNSATPPVWVKNNAMGVEQVRLQNGRYAFLTESTTNDYINNRKPCDTMKVGNNLDSKGYGIGTPIGSDLRDRITLAVLELREMGDLQKLQKKWWYGEGECGNEKSGKKKDATSALKLSGVAGVFYILVGGLVLALVMAVIEFIYKSRVEARRRKTSFSNAVRSKARLSIKGKPERQTTAVGAADIPLNASMATYTYAPAAQLISLDGYADGNTHTQV